MAAAKPKSKYQQLEQGLDELAASLEKDPEGFVLAAFPWGEPGALKGKRPRKWFLEVCRSIGEKLRANDALPADMWKTIREATASGHGIGKSAGMAMLILWAITTRHTRGVCTANTDTQLRTKTWTELLKWHNLSIFRHKFKATATSIQRANDATWRIDAVPWSANNTEAFAGLHNEGQRVFLGFDEASAIADPVWETAEGAMTDAGTQIIWVAWGNPTRSQGRFRKCFSDVGHRRLWSSRNVDSRTVDGTNKGEIERWRVLYGDNSQFFNVRVKGEFVEADPDQLISLQWITEARMRGLTAKPDGSMGKFRLSVDVASGGEDASVFTTMVHYDSFRHLVKQSEASYDKARGAHESAIAAERIFADFRRDYAGNHHDIVVDSTGVGDGTAGHLIAAELPVVAYKGGEQAADPSRYRNARVQCYIGLRNDLRDGRLAIAPDALPDEESWIEFEAQMCSVKSKPGTEKLEDLVTKSDMIRAGIKSPDRADSLAMQYAHKAVHRLASASAPMLIPYIAPPDFDPRAW